MKMIVVKEVEGLLYRHNLSEKAQWVYTFPFSCSFFLIFCLFPVFRYYVICFLNQVVINPQDKSLALKLVHIYFSFFKVRLEREREREGMCTLKLHNSYVQQCDIINRKLFSKCH